MGSECNHTLHFCVNTSNACWQQELEEKDKAAGKKGRGFGFPFRPFGSFGRGECVVWMKLCFEMIFPAGPFGRGPSGPWISLYVFWYRWVCCLNEAPLSKSNLLSLAWNTSACIGSQAHALRLALAKTRDMLKRVLRNSLIWLLRALYATLQ